MRKQELTPLRKALDYQISREWRSPGLHGEEAIAAYETAALEVEKLAREGLLTIWGVVDANGRPAPIPERAWREVQIDRQTLFEDAVHTAYRKEKKIHPYPLYYVLHFDKLQMESVLPPLGWFGKLARTLRGRR